MKNIYLSFVFSVLFATGIVAQSTKYYGIWTEKPEITQKWGIDDVTRHLYVWDGTLVDAATTPAVSYGNPMGYKGTNVGWWGFGLFDDSGADLSAFANGYLSFYIACNITENVEIIISDQTKPKAKEKKWALTTADFARDGKWHLIELPVSEAVAAGVNLSSMGHVFAVAGGGNPSLIAFDDIYYKVELETSVRQSKVGIDLSLSPNPATKSFKVSSDKEIAEISIVNMVGSTVYKTNRSTVYSPFEIDVSGWTKGTYIVTVRNRDGLSKIEKILVK